MKIGFIGQGWIGKNYADDFEHRGFEVVRYALEEPYIGNVNKIKDCEIVFVAVPTPTTPKGFDDSILRKAIKGVGPKKIAVIKSSMLPGTTELIQKENPDIYVVHSPEFLREASAAYDASHPMRNIIGIPIENAEYRDIAEKVMNVLPEAPFKKICSAKEAELVKYAGNVFLFLKVVYANMLYDIAEKLGCDWETVKTMLSADPRIGSSHLEPVHDQGRGAGGDCFIKDFSAFIELSEKLLQDESGLNFLKSAERKNINLLMESGKDLALLEAVYGGEIIKNLREVASSLGAME